MMSVCLKVDHKVAWSIRLVCNTAEQVEEELIDEADTRHGEGGSRQQDKISLLLRLDLCRAMCLHRRGEGTTEGKVLDAEQTARDGARRMCDGTGKTQ